MIREVNKRSILVSEVCTACVYWGYCGLHMDCEALKILVKIYEDIRSDDPSNGVDEA